MLKASQSTSCGLGWFVGQRLIDSSVSQICLIAYEGRLKVAKFNAIIYFTKKNKQLHSVSLLQPSSHPPPGGQMLLIFYPFSNKIKKTVYVSGQCEMKLWPHGCCHEEARNPKPSLKSKRWQRHLIKTKIPATLQHINHPPNLTLQTQRGKDKQGKTIVA